MNALNVLELLSGVAERLVETSIVGGLLALGVWTLCRLAPALPPAVRCWLWWGVALKMLLGLLPLPAVALPLLPTARDVVAASVRFEPHGSAKRTAGAEIAGSARGSAALGDAQPRTSAVAPASSLATSLRSSIPWRLPLVALWLAGLAVELARAGSHLLRARRVVCSAEPVTDAALLATFEALRQRLDVPAAELRISRAAATPQVVGARKPVVLLPAGMCERFAGEELAMALGHELLHVRRADLLLGLVPALAARCFFFHPLARLVEREHALAREEACDAAVVARLAPSPRAYGRLLLELALGCGTPPLRAAAAAVTHTTLQRRLQMLLQPARPFRPAFVIPLLLLGVGALVPLRVTARETAAGSAASPAPAAAAATEPARAGEPAPVVDSAVAVEPGRAAEPSARPALLSTLAVAAPSSERESTHHDRDDGEDAWVYIRDAGHHTMMSGRTGDADRARRQLRGDEPLFWARRGDAEWVVRDPAFLARLEEIYGPVRELGAKQAELGGKQAELGSKQAELGAQQAQLGAQQATLGSQQATIGAQGAQLSAQQAALSAQGYHADEAERAALESRQREIDRARRELDRQIEQLSEQQNELARMQNQLGERQNELGGKQNELGERQNELGRRQQEASELAERAMRELLDEAIRTGVATRVE